MTVYPKVSFEYFKRGDEDPTPHRAHIVVDDMSEPSDHHGLGASPSEALINAALHWHSYRKKQERKMSAKIYQRINGDYGSSCDGIADTGHHITKDAHGFTVYSVHDVDELIARFVSQETAEKIIAADWRKPAPKY